MKEFAKDILIFTGLGLAAGMFLTIVGCGSQSSDSSLELNEVNQRIQALSTIAGELDTIIRSDFSSCPASGATADPLIQKICQVAQASTVELQVQLQSEMGAFVNQLQDQINAANNDLASHQISISGINASLINLQSDIASLATRMTSAEAAIAALQSLTAGIVGTLNGAMIAVVIGEELVSAGPTYESVLRRADKTRVNGYVEAYGSALSLPNDPVTAVNGSATVTVAMTAHGLSVGDLVKLTNLNEGRGFTSGDLLGDFEVLTVPNANSFTIQLRRTASQNGTLGGTVGVAQKVNGRGMAQLWASGQVSDSAVRVTSAGTRRYNFIIRRIASDATNATAELCYDSSNRSASFATINAAPEGGAGNVVCK